MRMCSGPVTDPGHPWMADEGESEKFVEMVVLGEKRKVERTKFLF